VVEKEMLELLVKAKDSESARLRADLSEERAMNAKLWAAVAHLQCACGTANEWWQNSDNETAASEEFSQAKERADEVLDGIVALAEADQ
jgi:hypothetical protein